MKLSKLARLEKVEVQKERNELTDKINDLDEILGNHDKQIDIIRERLGNLVKKYGDARRTELKQIAIEKEEKEIETVTPEDVVVIVSQTGNIKRIPKSSFRTQRRGGKGIKTADNAILSTIRTNTIDNLLIFTNKGKMYKILVDNIIVGTNVSKGDSIGNLIKLDVDEKVIAVTNLARENKSKYVVFITKQGLLKKTAMEEYTKTKRSTGITAINLKEGDSLANIELMDEEEIVTVTKNGLAIRFETKDIAPIGRVTSGVKAIKLNDGDEVLTGLPIRNQEESLAVITSRGNGKKTKLDEFPVQARAGKGLIVYKTTDITGNIAGAAMVGEEDNLLLIGTNSICISATDIPQLGRATMGNVMIKDGNIKGVVKL